MNRPGSPAPPPVRAVIFDAGNTLLRMNYAIIAEHLGITPRTVEFHRANIFEKLRVNSAVELAHRMGRLG